MISFSLIIIYKLQSFPSGYYNNRVDTKLEKKNSDRKPTIFKKVFQSEMKNLQLIFSVNFY